jgi:hypothetical protein
MGGFIREILDSGLRVGDFKSLTGKRTFSNWHKENTSRKCQYKTKEKNESAIMKEKKRKREKEQANNILKQEFGDVLFF